MYRCEYESSFLAELNGLLSDVDDIPDLGGISAVEYIHSFSSLAATISVPNCTTDCLFFYGGEMGTTAAGASVNIQVQPADIRGMGATVRFTDAAGSPVAGTLTVECIYRRGNAETFPQEILATGSFFGVLDADGIRSCTVSGAPVTRLSSAD